MFLVCIYIIGKIAQPNVDIFIKILNVILIDKIVFGASPWLEIQE